MTVDAPRTWPETIVELAEALGRSERRHGLPYSRAGLAKRLGVAHVTLYRWVNGSTKPTGLYLAKLIDACTAAGVAYPEES